MSHELPPTIDPVAAKHWHETAAAESPWLHEEVASRMQQRLDWIVKPPERWCHWEPVRGGMVAHNLLRERYPQAECTIYEPVARRQAVAEEKLASRWWQLSRWKGAGVQVAEPAEARACRVSARLRPAQPERGGGRKRLRYVDNQVKLGTSA